MEQTLALTPMDTQALQIIFLTWERVQLQSEVIRYRQEEQLRNGQVQYESALAALLERYQAQLPVPVSAVRIDVSNGLLRYDLAALPATDAPVRASADAEGL